jgi:hypothetical protein
MHLILGTVNDEVQAIYRELLVLDKIDSASVERMEQFTADVADSVLELIDRAEEVIFLLTSSDAFVSKKFGPAPSLGRIVEQQPLTIWSGLINAAKSSAAVKTAKALELGALKKNPRTNFKANVRQLERNKKLRPRWRALPLRSGLAQRLWNQPGRPCLLRGPPWKLKKRSKQGAMQGAPRKRPREARLRLR